MAEKAADVPVEFLKPAEGDELDKIPNYGGSLGTLTEIAEKKKNGIEPTYSKLSSWFSSLWTLQEAALCPDLMLASRHWKLLRDGHGQPIPLNALVLFVSYHETYVRQYITDSILLDRRPVSLLIWLREGIESSPELI